MKRSEPAFRERPAPWMGPPWALGLMAAALWSCGLGAARAQEVEPPGDGETADEAGPEDGATPQDEDPEGGHGEPADRREPGDGRPEIEPEGTPREAARIRIAVLLVPAGEVAAETADGLTELLIGSVAARGGAIIVGKEEFQAQLGQGDEGTLDCISSTPCIGRVGVQLGVREVIAGTLARRDGTWVFNLNRLDVRSGEVLARVFREVDGELGEVADALGEAIPELYLPRPEPQPLLALAGLVVAALPGAEVFLDGNLLGTVGETALHTQNIPIGPHEVRVSAPGHDTWSRTIQSLAGGTTRLTVALTRQYRESVSPWFYVSASLAAASLGTAIGLGVASQGSLELGLDQRLEGEVTRAEALRFYDARQLEATFANVLFGVAGLAAGVAVAMLFFPERIPVAENEGTTVALRVGAGHLALEGRF